LLPPYPSLWSYNLDVDIYQSEVKGEVKIPDPYAWLEKDEGQKWLTSQEALARNFIDAHPDRMRLEKKLGLAPTTKG
jgi:prolyl oligopeptidase